MEIKPTYATFEQAKLLFEKGFDIISKQSKDTREGIGYIPLYMAYYDYSLLFEKYPDVYKDEIVLNVVSPNSSLFGAIESFYSGLDNILPTYHAPEQWQVVEWLRQKGIIIELIIDGWGDDLCVDEENLCYRVFIWQIGKAKPSHYDDLGAWSTTQKAYSAAFDYILKELI